MFTGIIEETGVVRRVAAGRESIRLEVAARATARGLRRGDSLAVNGCCLTVTRVGPGRDRRVLEFDLLRETWLRTNLQFVQPGALVNLERPLRAGDRLGGHFVTGHVDGLGRITRWEQSGRDFVLEVAPPPALMRYIAHKGSIAVDGISLTVAAVTKKFFRVWIIPHTREVTVLRARRAGDAVNVETDVLARHVERLLSTAVA
jgi:riboflavin synthase